MDHWNRINRVFQSDDIYMPILLEDEHGASRGNDWAKGFLRGTQLRHAEWTAVAGSEEHGGPFVCN
ncbi:UPF0149 family protein [Aestuariivirga sp.]|uniref:UPF0149 family protein n=1 Tax=Aestuariivirga sp. TaxID=2650926 RepID=UPI003593D882